MNPAAAEVPMYADALAAALAIVEVGAVEPVALDAVGGRVLREPIVADRDLPPFDRAQMDGYALRHAELRVNQPMPVVARIAAGSWFEGSVPAGSCVAIATGAPIPPGLDTVVEHERSDRADRFDEGAAVRFDSTVARGHAVHPRGVDARRGSMLLDAGTVLAAHHVAIAATAGIARPIVAVRPSIAVLTSGDEVVAPEATPRPEQIRNGNGPMITALVAAMGGAVGAVAHVVDESEPTRRALADALAAHDIVVTIGGISAGERDRFRVVAEELGATFVVRRARLQPGGPIVVGRGANGAVLLGLPGNPVSALVCSHLFLWPIIRRRLGVLADLPWRRVVLAAAVTPNATRQAFRPAAVGADGRAMVPRWAGSGDLVHTAAMDGLVELPMQPAALEPGTPVRFLPWVDSVAAHAARTGAPA